MANFKSHKIKVNTNESKSYFNAHDAILDSGFEYLGEYRNENPVRGTIKRDIYKRVSDNKIFAFAGMTHFNTTVYYFNMREYSGHLPINNYIY